MLVSGNDADIHSSTARVSRSRSWGGEGSKKGRGLNALLEMCSFVPVTWGNYFFEFDD